MLGINASASAQPGDAYSDMNVAEFADYIRDKNVQLLDVRTPAEFAEGHIDGARNIDIYDDTFVQSASQALDSGRPVAVYCRSGKRSAEAARKLLARGYEVTNLLGGILAWEKAGMHVSSPVEPK